MSVQQHNNETCLAESESDNASLLKKALKAAFLPCCFEKTAGFKNASELECRQLQSKSLVKPLVAPFFHLHRFVFFSF